MGNAVGGLSKKLQRSHIRFSPLHSRQRQRQMLSFKTIIHCDLDVDGEESTCQCNKNAKNNWQKLKKIVWREIQSLFKLWSEDWQGRLKENSALYNVLHKFNMTSSVVYIRATTTNYLRSTTKISAIVRITFTSVIFIILTISFPKLCESNFKGTASFAGGCF